MVLGRRRRRGQEAPPWAPNYIDCFAKDVSPIEGWLLLQERFDQDKSVEVSGIRLEIARPGVTNTVFGKVLAIHPDTAKELHVATNDVVVYREWEGGRWDFNGDKALLIDSRHILAKVTE